MKMLVCKTFTLDAAHYLPHYEGKCRNLHGHTWTLEVEVSSTRPVGLITVGPKQGMVVDFEDLKDLVNSRVVNRLDHTLLNDLVKNPTCENLLTWMWDNLADWVGGLSCELSRLRLYETPGSFAELKL